MNATELVRQVEEVGGTLHLKGDRIRYELPEEAETLVPELRRLRNEVLVLLKKRPVIPPLPNGVSVVEWAPKQAPVVLTRCSVVVDVPKFIYATLRELEATLAGKEWLGGNRSVREILERLEQVGLTLRIEVVQS
jgi:hypothetical protein